METGKFGSFKNLDCLSRCLLINQEAVSVSGRSLPTEETGSFSVGFLFRCNAFSQDPDWEEMEAASRLEAEEGVFARVNRN